ncbi:hypothetical protein GQ607_014940 [Colletotrichum asianum]|uniref:Integral membrane protein n=1 Tax=Colletotrichum asianum TaxID=702518 RepID=A0A8H3ZG25_9PEZI|nr:hypothetical protein GQ607_014940 [Colletotrichum asianum]
MEPATPDIASLGDSSVTTRLEDQEPIRADASRGTEKQSEAATDTTLPVPSSPIYAPTQADLTKHRRRWIPRISSRLRNTLLSTMGLLELANAGDFAANVWNEIPVPIYAIVFMALGGTLALVVSILALKDTLLSWQNVCFLRNERAALKAERLERLQRSLPTLDVDVLLDTNFREFGSEIANRFGLDICSGFGAFLISIGTYMAIGGANRQAWFASNILSGYLGNAPIALYGLISSGWSAYIFRRASQHRGIAAQSPRLQGSRAVKAIERRTRNVHIYTLVSAVSSVIGGGASMVTATRWEGYVVLIPVILSSMFYNSWLRRNVAYDRPPAGDSLHLTEDAITHELEVAEMTWREIRGQSRPLREVVADTTSLEAVTKYLVANDLLEHFCLSLMKSAVIAPVLASQESTDVTIDTKRLLEMPKEIHPTMIEIANETIKQKGPKHFEYRQRYLAEILGSTLRLSLKAGCGGSMTEC